MLGQPGKMSIKLQCTEQSLPEFPNLLFGTSTETGRSYFDATFYLQKQDLQVSVTSFFAQYQKPIVALCESYGLTPDDVYKINQNGHYLIDGNFVYLFIAFVEPNFLGYMCDRIHELFSQGVSVSDTYLLRASQTRLSKEVLEAIIPNDEETE